MQAQAAIPRLRVKYYHERKGSNTGNIIWAERDRGSAYYRISKFAMNHGRFPANHPAAPNCDKSLDGSQCGMSDALQKFRARGYWASCFPEGDGITLYSINYDKSPEEVIRDIEEVFGWDVEAAS